MATKHISDSSQSETCMNKLTFPTKALAEAAIIYAQWQHGTASQASPARAYICNHCHKWHIASAHE